MDKPLELKKPSLVREEYGGEIYEYYPLGKYVVVAPGVCGGRPTFKYTRLEVSMVLAMLARGETPEMIVRNYELEHLTPDAISEAIELANQALTETMRPLAVAV
jgi:uncharacterized protein (DUF433 family)